MHNNLAPENPTSELFLQSVIDRQGCQKHGVNKGEPCGRMGPYRAICNARAKRAGFNHKISEKSLRLFRKPKSITKR